MLVGRAGELAVLDRCLAGVDAGAARVLGVAGEPGIGKTSLLAELGARSARRGHLVLTGGAGEFERTLPFGAFVAALDDQLASRPELAAEIGPDVLAACFPAVRAAVDGRRPVAARAAAQGQPLAPGADKYALFRGVRALLERLAAPSGLVLILDDLHWADAGSVELVGYLLRHLPRGPVLMAFGYRPRQAPPPLAAALAQAAGQGRADQLELVPLTVADTAALLGTGIGRSRCRALHEASGGNPFYLEALARAGGGQSAVPGGELGEIEGLSGVVHAALVGELDALSDPAREIVEAAAVAGDPFEPALVAEIAGLGEGAVLGLLDDLVGSDLVRPVDGSRWFRFRHPLVRHVTYRAAGAGWRWGAHARAAAALERIAAPVEARAHHVERSARHGDDDAVAVLVDAAHATLGRAPATAAHWYRAALELIPAGADRAPQRLELLWGQARALGMSGNLTASRDLLHQLLSVLPREPQQRRLETVTFCAQIERVLGLHAQVRALAAVELDALADHDTVAAAGLKLGSAVSGMQLDQSPAATRRIVDEVYAIASRHDDRPLQAAASAVLAMLSIQVWEPDRVGASLDRATALVDGLTDGELAARIDVANWLGWSELRLGRHHDALRHYDRALRVARATGQSHLLANLLLGRGNTLRWLGELPDAATCLEDATEAALLTGSQDLQTITLAVHSWVLTLGGDLAGALPLADQAVAMSRSAEGWYATLAVIRRAHAQLKTGGAEAAVIAVSGGPELPAVPMLYRAELYELLVQAALADPSSSRADDWAEHAERTAAALNLPGCTGFALLARAQVLAAAGDHGAAACRALAAAEAFDQAAQRLEAGRAHLVAGVALAAAGDRFRAANELSRAETLLAACHAAGLRAEAAAARQRLTADEPVAESRRVTVSKPGSTALAGQPGRAALTPRELQVAELVSLGHTNRQVSRALAMSEKTVEGHLSRVFAKLDVRSRAGLARLFAQSPN